MGDLVVFRTTRTHDDRRQNLGGFTRDLTRPPRHRKTEQNKIRSDSRALKLFIEKKK